MKKKIICIMAVCAMVLAGCGSSGSSSKSIDKAAQKVMDDIDSIGEVELEDIELIEKIEKTYDTLTEKQKDQINNYADLLNARDDLDLLIKQEEEEQRKKEEEEKIAEEKRIKEEEEARRKSYTEEVKFCVKAILTVKGMLKDPDSMQIHEFTYAEEISNEYKGKYFFIDISAKNGFGGTSRSIYTVTDDSNLGELGSLNTKFLLYCISDEVIDSELVSLFSTYDKVNHDAVYQLLEEYEETNDKSLLD